MSKKEKSSLRENNNNEKEEIVFTKEKLSKCNKRKKESDNNKKSNKKEKKNTIKKTNEAEIQKFRESQAITVESSFSYIPVMNFKMASELFPVELLKVCEEFDKPTPIQSESWPVCLGGHNMVGIAVTGSGKTLAFALPSILHLKDKPTKKKSPNVLIVAPTRELACQINLVYQSISKFNPKIHSVCIYGGVSKQQHIAELKQINQIVVATPGRLLSFIASNDISLSNTTFLVLDEADRMLDKGFEPDIRRICSSLHSTRQIVMFSATWPDEIQNLAKDFMKTFSKVTIGSCDLKANESIHQFVELVEKQNKNKRLLELLKMFSNGKDRILIFVLYKREAPQLVQFLSKLHYQVVSVHGDMNQYERSKSVEDFKQGIVPILIATDVCARGLDIPKVQFVINYSFPLTIEDYIHRIGRTGRAGCVGSSYTFFTQFDKHLGSPLCEVLRGANQKIPSFLEKYSNAPTKAKRHKLYGSSDLWSKLFFTHVEGHILEDTTPMKAPTKIIFDDD